MSKKEILVIIFLLFFSAYSIRIYISEARYPDEILIEAIPSNEGCDDFKQGWTVTKVSNMKYNFLLHEVVYFTNNPVSYDSASLHIKSSGWLYKFKNKKAQEGKCSYSYSFYDEYIDLMKE